MAITFACGCGKILRAGDELAGKKARCPQCASVVPIPGARADAAPADPGPTGSGSLYEVEEPPRPSSSSILRPRPPVVEGAGRPATPARPSAPKRAAPTKPKAGAVGESSLLEYSYLLLVFALIPLVVSLLSKEQKLDLQDRLARSIASAPPEEQKRIEGVFSREAVSLDEALAALPGGKLEGAHLARNSSTHWVYAAIAAAAFLLFLGLVFSTE